LILKIIIKATRCHILWLQCPKFDFGVHNASPDSLAGFRGPTSKRRGGRRKEKGKGWRGKGRGGCVMAIGGWTPLHTKTQATRDTNDYRAGHPWYADNIKPLLQANHKTKHTTET